jgi:shikimate kinase
MPGGGKSTVGRHLARQLGWAFVDSDTEIEKRIGCSVREYFDRQGEDAFRDLEQKVIAELSASPPALAAGALVLATGGGSVLRRVNRENLRHGSTVVYLRCSPEELFRRLRHDTARPLLQVRDPLRKLRDLHRERDPLYRDAAHFIIETGRPSVPTLVNMVLMQLELAGVIDHLRGGAGSPSS